MIDQVGSNKKMLEEATNQLKTIENCENVINNELETFKKSLDKAYEDMNNAKML